MANLIGWLRKEVLNPIGHVATEVAQPVEQAGAGLYTTARASAAAPYSALRLGAADITHNDAARQNAINSLHSAQHAIGGFAQFPGSAIGSILATAGNHNTFTPTNSLERLLAGNHPTPSIQGAYNLARQRGESIPSSLTQSVIQLASDAPFALKGVRVGARLAPPAINDLRFGNQIGAVGKRVSPTPSDIPLKKPAKVSTPVKAPVQAAGKGTGFKKALLDNDQVILSQLRKIDKANPVAKGQPTRVQSFMYNSNMTRGSNAIANQVFQNSKNIKSGIGGLNKKDYKAFSDYANARTELSTATKNTPTSLPVSELKKVVASGHQTYAPRFEALNNHYKELAKVAKDSSLIDAKTFKQYTANNNYLRLQKDMGDKLPDSFGQGKSYSIGSTILNQRRKGSNRANLPVGETAAHYTQQVYREAARNKTSTQLLDNLSQHGLAAKLPSAKAATHQNVAKLIRDGKVEYYRVSPDMKQAIDNINPYQMNAIMQILSVPGRTLRAGVTGLNPVFIARNLIKDQAGSAINSKALRATHNPVSFFSGLYNASKGATGLNHDPLWQDFIKHYGDQTSYDLTRNLANTKHVVNTVRGGKKYTVGYNALHPLRALENVAQITEKSTRFQNYRGAYKRAIKQGYSKQEASERAAMQAWQNSVDFSRAGEWGRVINTVIPYWNPATQGVRQMSRTFTSHPIKSTFTGTAILGVPIAAATAWNLKNEDTKKVYDNIPENEKDNNLILVPPGTKQNQDGTYDVIKIPLPPGYKDVFMPIRRAIEAYNHDKPLEGKQIAQDIIQSVSGPISLQTKSQAIGSITPQAIKPFVQAGANKDLFSGRQTVPDYMLNATDAQGKPVPAFKQAYKNTSGTARLIGDKLNISPIKIEKGIKDIGGTVALNLLNATDRALASKGVIAKNQIGGQSLSTGFKKSFAQTYSINNENKTSGAQYYAKKDAFAKTLTPQEQTLFNKISPTKNNFLGDKIFESSKLTKVSDYGDLIANPAFAQKYQRYQKSIPNHDPLWDLNRNDLRSYMQAQVISKNNPGGDSATVSALYDRLPQDFFSKRDKYFAGLKAKGVKLGSNYTPRPTMPSDLVAFSDAYHKLPYGTGDRSAAIRSAEGQKYIAWLEKNRLYNNQERADLGLPPLEDPSAKYASSSGKGRKPSSTAFKTASKTKAYKPKGIKVRKLATPNFKSSATRKLSVSKLPSNYLSKRLG